MVRALRSPLFYLTAAAMALSQILSVWQEMAIVGETSVLYLYRASNMPVANVILCAVPFGTAFCTEWNNHYTPYAVQRSSVSAYAWSKLLSGALSGALAICLGYVLFLGGLAIHYPLILPDGSMKQSYIDYSSYGPLLSGGHTLLFYGALILARGLTAMVCAASAIAVSAFVPNLFVVLGFPIVFFYVYINAVSLRLINFNFVLGDWGVEMLLEDWGIASVSPGRMLLYALAYTAAHLALLGALFRFGVGKRIAHG